MSAEEDADLRDLVAHTLESNGVLGKIKAELRAKVFMVLEAHDKNETNQLPVMNENLRNFMNTKEGRLVTGLVREFLEFFELDFSLAVFDPETNFGDRYQGRAALAEDLNVTDGSNNSKPILALLLENSPQGIPKLDFGTLTDDKLKKGRVSPEISPRSLSSGSRNSSPRMSRIPQRVKDKKKGEKPDTKYPKDVPTEKTAEEDTKPPGFKLGNADLSLSLNDEDILAEFTQPRHGISKDRRENETKKRVLLDEDTSRLPQDDLWLRSPGNNFGSLKGVSLTAPKDLGVSSPSPGPKDLTEIDRGYNESSFGVPAEDKNRTGDFNDDYADDFHPSTHSNDDHSSIPEEIEGELSVDSYRSEGSKAGDLITTDRTVSPIDFEDFDYGEAVAKF